MNIGVSLFLLTIGAILTFAVDVSLRGLDLTTVGIILMIVGGFWFLLSLILLANRRGRPMDGGIVEERRIYNDDPLG
ncbi:MAG: DUF6458 family protein [Mycobacteriales bacterium]